VLSHIILQKGYIADRLTKRWKKNRGELPSYCDALAHTVLKSVRRRVAAYARVSTESEEQLTSYEAQGHRPIPRHNGA
jgi:hypothetical protein